MNIMPAVALISSRGVRIVAEDDDAPEITIVEPVKVAIRAKSQIAVVPANVLRIYHRADRYTYVEEERG